MSRFWNIPAVIALSLIAIPLAAQGASRDTSGLSTDSIVAVAPSITPSLVAARASLFASDSATTAFNLRAQLADVAVARSVDSPNASRNSAMMIVGGAAIIVGAILGGNAGSAIAVGGGVVGLVGLWRYLR